MTQTQPNGFLALPPAGTGAGVLVLHPWWGLNDTIKTFCNRLAEAGFVVFAPDLYHGKIATTIPEAEALANALDGNAAAAEIAEAVGFLGKHLEPTGRPVAVVGFSLGAYFALALSAADPQHIHSVVIFYGTGPEDFTNSQAEYLGHFAETDEFEPPENVAGLEAALQRAGRPTTIHTYPGTGHWFFEPDVEQAYNPSAAELAWERTLAFLKRSFTR
jgi:carboxymethylenebutenolidase